MAKIMIKKIITILIIFCFFIENTELNRISFAPNLKLHALRPVASRCSYAESRKVEPCKAMAAELESFKAALKEAGASDILIESILQDIPQDKVKELAPAFESLTKTLAQAGIEGLFIYGILRRIERIISATLALVPQYDVKQTFQRLSHKDIAPKLNSLILTLKELGLDIKPIMCILSPIIIREDIKQILQRLNQKDIATELSLFIKTFKEEKELESYLDCILSAIVAREDVKERAQRLNHKDIASEISLLVRTLEEKVSEGGIHARFILKVLSTQDDVKQISTTTREVADMLQGTEQARQAIEQEVKQKKAKARFLRSIVGVYGHSDDKDRGSGFVAGQTKDYYLVFTNSHVVGQDKSVVLKTHTGEMIGEASVVVRYQNVLPDTADWAILAIGKKEVKERAAFVNRQDRYLAPVKMLSKFEQGRVATLVSGLRATVSTGLLVAIGDAAILLGGVSLGGDSGSPYLVKSGNEYFAAAVAAKRAGPTGMLLTSRIREDMLRALKAESTTQKSLNFTVCTDNAGQIEAVRQWLAKKEVEIAAVGGITYEKAVEWRRLKVEEHLRRLPKGFWTNPITAKNMIFVTLDTIPGFRQARAANDIKTMAELYRQHVINYKPKDTEKYDEGGQHTFFCEVGGLKGLMVHPRDYLLKVDSPAALLRFALRGLIDLINPDALDPLEVELDYWNDPDNGRYHILQALDTIPGLRQARAANDIKTMAGLYRKYVINYKPKDTEKYPYGGQFAFFCEVGGLRGLMGGKPRDYLAKTGSPAALLRFALPGLIDLTNPNALDPLEVELDYWNDPDNGRYHIFQAMDTIPGFRQARETNDIKTMAELYRKYVINYKPKDTEKYPHGGQVSFFREVGGLRVLMGKPRDYLLKVDSPAALLRFALRGLIDDTNPDALKSWEVEKQSIGTQKTRRGRAVSNKTKRFLAYVKNYKRKHPGRLLPHTQNKLAKHYAISLSTVSKNLNKEGVGAKEDMKGKVGAPPGRATKWLRKYGKAHTGEKVTFSLKQLARMAETETGQKLSQERVRHVLGPYNIITKGGKHSKQRLLSEIGSSLTEQASGENEPEQPSKPGQIQRIRPSKLQEQFNKAETAEDFARVMEQAQAMINNASGLHLSEKDTLEYIQILNVAQRKKTLKSPSANTIIKTNTIDIAIKSAA